MSFKKTLFSCFSGIFTQAITNNLAPLLFVVFRDNYGLSFEMIGRLILINFATQLIADCIIIKIADRIGIKKLLIISQILSASGLCLLGAVPLIFADPYIWLCATVIIYALGGGIIEVLVSPVVNDLPVKNKQSAMSLLHSFYCWGQVLVVLGTTFTLVFIGQKLWFFIPFAWAIVPAITAIFMINMPMPDLSTKTERISPKQLFRTKTFIILLILMLTAGSAELAMSQWSSIFAEKGLGISKVSGDIYGPCLFAALMGLGRLGYSIFGKKTDIRRYLIFCAFLCVTCYLCAALVPVPIIALGGCALCGFSISMMWPGILTIAAQRFPGGGTALFGGCALAGDIGCSIGPWLTGIVAQISENSQKMQDLGSAIGLNPEQTGLRTGLFSAAIFPLVFLILLFTIKKISPYGDKT